VAGRLTGIRCALSLQKVDLGTCPKSHTARLKDEYDAAVAKGEAFPAFEVEHEDSIRTFMADIDRKIAANKRRIDISPEETAKFTTLLRDIQDVDAAVAAAEKEVERLGEAGQIDESLAELQKVEALKQEKADRERELQVLSDSAGASGHQKLRVCDVCGAYLSILDSDRRLADHFGGRVSERDGRIAGISLTHAPRRCTWATSSCARSSRPSTSAARRARTRAWRWRHSAPTARRRR
jgi:DNA repair exonuclease SbcCD ATPase subunit